MSHKNRKHNKNNWNNGNSAMSDFTESQFSSIYARYPDQVKMSALNTTCYEDSRLLKVETEKKYDTIIDVWNMDTIEAGEQMVVEGYNPVLINMASSFKPGGGWRKGSKAQEESLFYRTTYAISLENSMNLDPDRKWRYPLRPYTLIYSPNIFVFGDRAPNGITVRNWKDCSWMNFIAIAALRKPKLKNGREFYPQDRLTTKDKIIGFFKVALLNGHDSMVLGALGCGAYSNPVDEIVQIFKEVCELYDGSFKKIVFAIIEDKNSRGGNVKPFRDVFVHSKE